MFSEQQFPRIGYPLSLCTLKAIVPRSVCSVQSFPLQRRRWVVLLTEKPAPYFIDEKTLDSTGLQVSRTPQLARYINGASCLWIGRKKEAGKGLGWSNLKFDQISEK